MVELYYGSGYKRIDDYLNINYDSNINPDCLTDLETMYSMKLSLL